MWAVTEEHLARTKAEGELENTMRRLAVAQEQIAEFATERSREAAELLSKATQLQGLLEQRASTSDPAQLAQVRAWGSECRSCCARQLNIGALQALLGQLQDMAQDTAAFAQQQKADAERTKRSFSQVSSMLCLSL